MLHLLHPAALWTLAALALPLAIHLRRPPPRTVRLGSLRFLENAPRHPLRNLRWRELLLLGTRLGLLAALALLLAEPRWTVSPPAGPRRWALLDPTAALAGDSLGRWRAARANGDELRRLVPGFPVVADESSPAADPGHAIAPDLWSLLREADAELPPGSTLEVFSPARLAALRGTRPALSHCRVEWVQTPDVTDGVAHVWVPSALEKRLVAGRSDARSTTYTVGALGEPLVFPTHEDERWQTDPGDAAPGSTHILSRENDPAHATDRWTVDVPPPALSVLILRDAEHVADARYVEAAVRAAAGAEGRAVNLQNREITPDAENAATTDWTFWLSARPMPEGFAAREGRIVSYASGETTAADDWIVAPSGDAADGVRLWRRAVFLPQSPAGVAWWRDGRGDPLLTYSHPTAGERWELFTRFDPAWTDLPRTTALPAWTRALLFPGAAAPSPADPIHDRRLADPSQGLPSETPAASIPMLAPADQPSTELRWLFWTLAALLFAVERVLSLLPRRSSTQRAAAPRTEPVAASR